LQVKSITNVENTRTSPDKNNWFWNSSGLPKFERKIQVQCLDSIFHSCILLQQSTTLKIP